MDWLDLLWTVVIYGLVFYILYWILSKLQPRLGEPFGGMAIIILYVVAGIAAIMLLLGRLPLIPAGHIGGVSLIPGG